jgi:Asp-tRNA(Asn)/Glu-tRNA(Gln) amidotransferase C subunit
METSTFELLCSASQLSFASFPEEETEAFRQRLDCMIEFSSAVKDIDCDLKLAESTDGVKLSDLRGDTAKESLPPGKLLSNTEPLFDCYVIPKIME